MDPFTIATIGSALFGGVSSILGGNAASRSAAQAGRIQAGATAAATQTQREQLDRATQTLSPYAREGTAARRSYNALLGIPTTAGPNAGGAASQSRGQILEDWVRQRVASGDQLAPTRERYAAMGQKNGELLPNYETWLEQTLTNNGVSADDIVNGARQAPGAGPQDNASTLDADRTAAYGAFNQSPYAVAAQTGADKAQQTIMGNAGANSRVLSGRTLNATQNNATQYKQNALLSYMDNLNGVAARGFDADSGIASAGQTFANNSSSAALQGAANQGNALMQGAQARQDGLQGAGTILANALGTYAGYKTSGANRSPGSYFAKPASGGAAAPGGFNGLLNTAGGMPRTPSFFGG